MKRLLLFEIILIFLATTFESDSPPGWYQQTIPVNKIINDIFFLDSSNGWAVTAIQAAGDTAFVLKTTNGGTNWNVVYNFTNHFRAIQFLDLNTGYIVGGTLGGTARTYKTTDGGISWNIVLSILSGSNFQDVFFINKDTGWVGDDNIDGGAGLRKTTNGGLNWVQQLSGSFGPKKIFFINKDTGWTICQNTNLYKTTNSGAVWTLQFAFSPTIVNLFFPSKDTGYISGNFGGHTIKKTINGGFNWDSTFNSQGGKGLYFINNTTGYNCDNFTLMQKTTNGGLMWLNQSIPSGNYLTIHFSDTLHGWAGGSKLISTTDGGGPLGTVQIGNELPKEYKLFQNYPNPFNPTTNIKYQIVKTSDVKLIVFDITGKGIAILTDKIQSAGTYQADWDSSHYSSGIYFYSLIINGAVIDTKKMILLK